MLRSIALFKQEAGRALEQLQAQLDELGGDEVHILLRGTAGAAGCGGFFFVILLCGITTSTSTQQLQQAHALQLHCYSAGLFLHRKLCA